MIGNKRGDLNAWYERETNYPPKVKATQNENVYVLHNPLNSTYKIGITKDVNTRLNALQTSSGINFIPVLNFELEEEYDETMQYIEEMLHKYFKDKRTLGEWFKLSQHDLNEIHDLFHMIDGEEILINGSYFKDFYESELYSDETCVIHH